MEFRDSNQGRSCCKAAAVTAPPWYCMCRSSLRIIFFLSVVTHVLYNDDPAAAAQAAVALSEVRGSTPVCFFQSD